MNISLGAPLLDLHNLRREYDDGRVVALAGVSLAVREGETVAIVGRSGSGKSTLIHLAAGLDEPTAGEIRFRGKAVRGRGAWAHLRARCIGIVFQSFNLLPTLTARQNVMIPMLGVEPHAGRRRRRAEELLAGVGLANRLDHRPAELSGGERQRVAIARSLANGPALLLADEPTGNLDTQRGREIMELLWRLNVDRGITILMVTHEPDMAAWARRVVRFVDGVVASDAPNEQPVGLVADGAA